MVTEIKLPKITIKYIEGKPVNQLLLVGGGRQPSKDWLQKAVNGRTLWCIDHGVDICHELGLVPERLLGDFDSCNSNSLQWAKDYGTIIEKYDAHKDFTDTQAALNKAQKDNCYTILTGAMGNRFDHTYSTIFSFGNSLINGCIADEQETIFFLRSKESIQIALKANPKAISLLPISPQVSGVNTSGLHWELSNAQLIQAEPYAVSNVQADEYHGDFTVSIGNGILAVYICWQE
ncbi:MAG: thiamine diphosphokinase [Anaerovibrio sp.]|uniref:thiamine diphosphokinase n=1 Tax=Anaerovibrio sp. TaxID=1872532 RepID=UPI0025D2AF00|nr:thiamine diphosphokinase [Anaerovibrio sp.]MCR5175876.1 thiamine diphosphokinase [Anaerovibrio sp.]